jgi:t-SNARE complex subunit (syntaxin)
LKIDEEIKQADKDAEEALDELTQAKDNKKKTAKCNLFMVGICVFSLVVASIVVLCS